MKKVSKRSDKLAGGNMFAGYMAQLLDMPACEEEKEALLASGFKGRKVNKGLILAQSVLDKAIEKGDVSAFKEVKALLSEGSDSGGQIDELVSAISRSLKQERGSEEATESKNNGAKAAAKGRAKAQEPE